MTDDWIASLTIGELRTELVGWPDDVPVTVAVPDRHQPSMSAVLPIVGAGHGPGINAGSDPVLSSAFPLAAAVHPGPNAGSDAWGVPDRLLGPLPPAFYEGIGRVAALTALLEDRLRTLLQAVRHAAQTAHAKDGAGRIVPELRRRTARLGADWGSFPAYLDDVTDLLERRNVLVHSLWQPTADGVGFFGHRLDPAAERTTVIVTMDDLRSAVVDAVHLIDAWQTWFALAGSLPWLAKGSRSAE
jgi:hypothetical protein